MEGYMAEVRMFGGNFAPRGWMFCQGQLMSIAEYTALYSLLGNIYGGDNQTTFALPNLAGRVPVGCGTGAGLSPMIIGQMGGTETNTLTASNIANHGHTITGGTAGILVSSEDGHSLYPQANYPAVNGDLIYAKTTDGSAMAVADISELTISKTGQTGPLPIDNMQPYLVINYIICVEGIFPSRN